MHLCASILIWIKQPQSLVQQYMSMRLTRFSDYSLRVLIYLGLHRDGPVTIREISDAYAISRNHLMKVVSNLTRLGYVDARRGPGGGLALASHPADMNLARIIEDTEEDMNLVECFQPNGKCVIDPVCRLRVSLRQALDAYMESLARFTLDDLLQPQADLSRLLDIE